MISEKHVHMHTHTPLNSYFSEGLSQQTALLLLSHTPQLHWEGFRLIARRCRHHL